VSQQIAALAKEVGEQLIEPDGRRVRLTPAGRRLADHAVTILAAVDAARLGSDTASSSRSGRNESSAIDIVLGLHATAHGIMSKGILGSPIAAATHTNVRPRWWSSGRWLPLWPAAGPAQ
jgi:hypothetical protein